MNHPAECECPTCLMADMNAHLRTIGIAPEAYEVTEEWHATAERTRYATPGAACGRGVVRLVSPAQVNFIKRLMAERDTSTLARLPGSENIEKMSLRGATDLIERLLACKELPQAAAILATPAQVGYAARLAAQKGLALTAADFAKQAKRDVSKAIDSMQVMADAPKPATTDTGEVTEDGMYRNPTTGEIFKVQFAVHGSGKLYAKKLIKLDTPEIKRGKEFSYGFEFASGAIRTLRAEWKMGIDEAAEFGRLYGCCIRCGAVLTLEDSIERGMGAWCAGKF